MDINILLGLIINKFSILNGAMTFKPHSEVGWSVVWTQRQQFLLYFVSLKPTINKHCLNYELITKSRPQGKCVDTRNCRLSCIYYQNNS